MPDGSPVLRRPALRAQAGAEEGRRPRLHLLHPPRGRVLPVQGPARARPAAGPGRPVGLLRPHPAEPGQRLPPQGDHHARADGHLGRVLPPRGRPRPAGDRPPLRRRPVHRRQPHDLPGGGQGGGAVPGHPRLVHAQAVHRAPGLGHAHPHVAVRGRQQRLLRRQRRAPPVQGRPALHRRPAASTRPRSPPSPTSGSTPTSGWPAAARRRATSAGAATTARRWSGCRCTSRTRAPRPGSSCARSTPPPTRTWPSR